MSKRQEQLQLFESHGARFTVLLNSMVFDGQLAALKPVCLAVLVVLKANAAWTNGNVFMGQRLIAKQAGVTTKTAAKALERLEAFGFIKKTVEEEGKRELYQLMDVVPLYLGPAFSEEGRQGEKAGQWIQPYVPSKVFQNRNQMLSFLETGELTEAARRSGITVNVTVNVTNINNAENVYLSQAKAEEIAEQLHALPDNPWKKQFLEWWQREQAQVLIATTQDGDTHDEE